METEVKRGAKVAMFLVLVALVGGLGLGVAEATGGLDRRSPAPAPAAHTAVRPSAQSAPQVAQQVPVQQVQPVTAPPSPPAAVLRPGDTGRKVRVLQSRLRQIAWYAGKVTDTYGPRTAAAVRGFQTKRGLPRLGYVDAATMDRLTAMTRRPTRDELANKVSDGTWTTARLDPRCTTGRALCVDKTSRTVRWVVDGEVRKTMAVRFGASYTPTREGLFHVIRKSRDHVSTLFGSSMPFAMFFSGGQAVHYSSDFAARGYSGASHGCV
ncbi:MAG: peptidoglycan-binding protein, partial [Marmoricola sp.]